MIPRGTFLRSWVSAVVAQHVASAIATGDVHVDAVVLELCTDHDVEVDRRVDIDVGIADPILVDVAAVAAIGFAAAAAAAAVTFGCKTVERHVADRAGRTGRRRGDVTDSGIAHHRIAGRGRRVEARDLIRSSVAAVGCRIDPGVQVAGVGITTFRIGVRIGVDIGIGVTTFGIVVEFGELDTGQGVARVGIRVGIRVSICIRIGIRIGIAVIVDFTEPCKTAVCISVLIERGVVDGTAVTTFGFDFELVVLVLGKAKETETNRNVNGSRIVDVGVAAVGVDVGTGNLTLDFAFTASNIDVLDLAFVVGIGIGICIGVRIGIRIRIGIAAGGFSLQFLLDVVDFGVAAIEFNVLDFGFGFRIGIAGVGIGVLIDVDVIYLCIAGFGFSEVSAKAECAGSAGIGIDFEVGFDVIDFAVAAFGVNFDVFDVEVAFAVSAVTAFGFGIAAITAVIVAERIDIHFPVILDVLESIVAVEVGIAGEVVDLVDVDVIAVAFQALDDVHRLGNGIFNLILDLCFDLGILDIDDVAAELLGEIDVDRVGIVEGVVFDVADVGIFEVDFSFGFSFNSVFFKDYAADVIVFKLDIAAIATVTAVTAFATLLLSFLFFEFGFSEECSLHVIDFGGVIAVDVAATTTITTVAAVSGYRNDGVFNIGISDIIITIVSHLGTPLTKGRTLPVAKPPIFCVAELALRPRCKFSGGNRDVLSTEDGVSRCDGQPPDRVEVQYALPDLTPPLLTKYGCAVPGMTTSDTIDAKELLRAFYLFAVVLKTFGRMIDRYAGQSLPAPEFS
ncbi:hypothetical protein [Stappia sediminis]|uniref:hypothetical protein n=1 Tax=Stappia sediminis TaxID=2692190 RepID=UPI001AD8C940|nr:hypothetical protein [Stappia sediminis]